MATTVKPTKEFSYSDNPNPNAKIGFVIFYPFQFYVLKNVYTHLKDEAEFVIDLGVFRPAKQPAEVLSSTIKLLNESNAFFRTLRYEDYDDTQKLETFFCRYRCLISLWMRGSVALQCNHHRLKVHFTYGVGKDLITYGFWKRYFNLILAYGERDHKIFSLYTESEIVGNPKFDDWFNARFDETLMTAIKKRLDPQKKTILYLPTHSDLCSIDEIADELKKLTKTYNIVVRFHYYTPREEPERVQKLQDPRIACFNDDADLITLLKNCDAILSDSSSVIFDAILADKPIVATAFDTDEYLDGGHGEYKPYRRGLATGLTYSGSIEQKIKKDGLVVTLKKPEELPYAVRKALEDPVFYKESRKKLREELFGFRDGKCGERAAVAIKNFLATKELPEKPLVWHLIEKMGRIESLVFFLEEKARAQKSASAILSTQTLKIIIALVRSLEKYLGRNIFIKII